MESGPARYSNAQSATGLAFLTRDKGHFSDWHPAPRRQYVIILAGIMEIGIGDGTSKRFGAGDVMLAEDTSGRGHTFRAAGDEDLRFATVPVDRPVGGVA